MDLPAGAGANETLGRFRIGFAEEDEEVSCCMLMGRCISFRDNEDLRMPPIPPPRDPAVDGVSDPAPPKSEPRGATTPTLLIPPSTIVAREAGRLGDADMSGREN